MTDDLPKIEECRPEVVAFARLMEMTLRANDYKGGWKGLDPEGLLGCLYDEVEEVDRANDAYYLDPTPHNTERIAKECADVANYAMMIADVCGGLPK